MTLALNIKQLSKTYKNKVEALKGIDLEVKQGDFFALLGPNGAGKSTTIGVITSLVNKTGGTVEVFGHNIDQELELAKSQLGLVPQEFNFNQFETVLQIVVHQAGYYGVPKKLALQRAEKYLSQLGLWDKRNSRARELSGGMKRRLMIARALMHEPKLLILDEPTAGVDIELRRSMWEFLRRINQQGVTIILTTHYLEEAEMLCRNIAIIDQGLIIENTSIKALLSKLSQETFVLDVDTNPAELKLDGFQFRLLDDHSLEVDVEKSAGLNDIFSRLTEQQVKVLSMRNKANRLEELFVKLVEQGRGEHSA
ncbi:ABC transporter ATP-binding protein [Alkalimonas amylolytica]|uniref:ABC-2 type transport system ATP-binding protein n=1 Tax=Alkalimonas amylolytica TaxID=152573 RepID=A0A1H3XGY2_ALKAM|nr:ABC transporter ATP-binding protein [Alkalimonas amylolytica]SDZ98606.1 ABC-2 type transport system ATP-binding protein [Alkalimonas amylolytica]